MKSVRTILKNYVIIFCVFVTTNLNAQVLPNKEINAADSTIYIKFNWQQEQKTRKESSLSYFGDNICSRWINFSENEFQQLRKFDKKKVKITLRHSFIEGLESKKARGIDTRYIQGISNNVSCEYIVSIDLVK